MSSFNDREKGFEAKFRLDQETQFKVTARRNKLLGLWAAGKMGLSGDDADSYARDVIAADFKKAGDSDVIEKVVTDLNARNVSVSEADVQRELEKAAKTARDQVLVETGKA